MVERISRSEITEIKRQFILRNMMLSPVEVSQLLNISVRKFYHLVEEGLIATISTRPGQTRGIRCTAAAIEEYRTKAENITQ